MRYKRLIEIKNNILRKAFSRPICSVTAAQAAASAGLLIKNRVAQGKALEPPRQCRHSQQCANLFVLFKHVIDVTHKYFFFYAHPVKRLNAQKPLRIKAWPLPMIHSTAGCSFTPVHRRSAARPWPGHARRGWRKLPTRNQQ